MAVNKVLALSVVLTLAACATPPVKSPAPSDPMNTSQGYYKVGKPYDIKGVTYTPAWDPNYDETGIASWYAQGFEGEPTANGELYDPNQLTAAHRTLPLPSLVRVTNLENGRALIVRLNDRGPYAQNRIIDLSRRCAQLLGMEKKGTAKVRVQILTKESLALADAARHGQIITNVASAIETNPAKIQVASNEAAEPPTVEQVEPLPDQPLPPLPTTPTTPLTNANGGVKVVDEKALIQQQTGDKLTGKDVSGRYLPAPKVQKEKVKHTNIYVQAGAFAQIENANKMRDKLHTLGTQILPVTINGKQLYRVRIGPLSSVPSADAELQLVIGAGATDAKIVVE